MDENDIDFSNEHELEVYGIAVGIGVEGERKRIFSKIKEWDISGDVYDDLIKVIMEGGK